MFGGVGLPELILILVILLMVFGVGKLPQVAEVIGSGVREFRKSLRGEADDGADSQELPDKNKPGEESK